MKFYNLTKLDVNAEDLVYDPYFKTCEQVIFVHHCNKIHNSITTKPISSGTEGSVFNYCSTGVLYSYFGGTNQAHSLICNLIPRIIKL
jgi:hypothetical protein